MKKIIIIVILVVVVAGIYSITSNNTPASNTPAPTTPSNVTVNIKNFSFDPNTLNIKQGTQVTWVNNDVTSHTVTSSSGDILNSPTLSPGESFSFTFNKAGTTNYYCNIHQTMRGVIIVE